MDKIKVTSEQVDIFVKIASKDNCKHCYGQGHTGKVVGGEIVLCRCVWEKMFQWEKEYNKHKEETKKKGKDLKLELSENVAVKEKLK